MANLLRYPDTCLVEKVVPKNSFYRHLDVSPRMKERFVNDVLSITWLYKLASTTLNIDKSEDMPEVEIFLAELKDKDCPTDLFLFIDKNMPHHLVFLLKYEQQYRLMVNYKEWATQEHNRFNITETFISPWVPAEQLTLPMEGNTLPKIYEGFVAQIGQYRIQAEQGVSLAESILAMQKREALEKRIAQLEDQLRKECQPRKKFELHQIIIKLRNELNAI